MRSRPTRLACTALLLVPLLASATTLIPHTLAQRAQASDRVALIDVVSRRTENDGSGRLKTFTRLKIVEDVRGTGPGEVTLVQLGGTLGDESLTVPGDATFAPGERALVFLHCPKADRCYLVAMGEGKASFADETHLVVHDLFTREWVRRPASEVIAELRKVPPGKVAPLAPVKVTR